MHRETVPPRTHACAPATPATPHHSLSTNRATAKSQLKHRSRGQKGGGGGGAGRLPPLPGAGVNIALPPANSVQRAALPPLPRDAGDATAEEPGASPLLNGVVTAAMMEAEATAAAAAVPLLADPTGSSDASGDGGGTGD